MFTLHNVISVSDDIETNIVKNDESNDSNVDVENDSIKEEEKQSIDGSIDQKAPDSIDDETPYEGGMNKQYNLVSFMFYTELRKGFVGLKDIKLIQDNSIAIYYPLKMHLLTLTRLFHHKFC